MIERERRWGKLGENTNCAANIMGREKNLCIEKVVGGLLKLINFIIYIYNSFNKCFIII